MAINDEVWTDFYSSTPDSELKKKKKKRVFQSMIFKASMAISVCMIDNFLKKKKIVWFFNFNRI